MSDSAVPRIAILEKNRFLGEAIASTLYAGGGYKVIVMHDHELSVWNDGSPDLVFFDVGWDTSICLDTVASLKDVFPRALVIGMNVAPGQPDILRLVEAGVSGFVERSASHDEYLEAARMVLRGECVVPGPVATALFGELSGRQSRTFTPSPGTLLLLTKRQRDIVSGIGKGLSNRELAILLCVSLHTVKSHVREILRRLGYKRRSQIQFLAWNLKLDESTGSSGPASFRRVSD